MQRYLSKLFGYKSLIVSLIKKDLKVKYAQTKLGLVWMLIQPIMVLVIFTVLFDQLIKLDTASIPYPVFAFSGMIVWYLFTNIVQSAGNSLIESQDIMNKIYFPKLILLLVKTTVALIESLVSLMLLIAIMLLFSVPFSIELLLLPIVILLTVLIGFTLAVWLSALSVKRRDLQHLIPYAVNMGIWLTPVFYPTSIIPKEYIDYFYYLNPIATIITFFRSLLFEIPFEFSYFYTFIVVIIFLFLGLIQFKKVEENIADHI